MQQQLRNHNRVGRQVGLRLRQFLLLSVIGFSVSHGGNYFSSLIGKKVNNSPQEFIIVKPSADPDEKFYPIAIKPIGM